ncbi:hypothetical protein S40285_04397 [Stachybotrys chlorohalonatus IBT 40285]|uniref:NAD(P)-binding domain-containing protein n=1 Tax=Stachybotrys chlorohalonatus (strain IBT 40285) TaxID=1283841 RepID=A0A084R1W2_STAC4|nr:hypothetical protein S40285_04397 [Stachybotrys chlorohalonata IBT 40285]
MHIAIAPAGTKTAAATIRALLALDLPSLRIKAYYRNLANVPDDFTSSPSIEAARGNIEDANSLDFSSVDAVLAITPPVFDGRDITAYAKSVSENVKCAVERAGSIKKLVLLSSIGAELETGVASHFIAWAKWKQTPANYAKGEIKANNIAESVFSGTAVPAITFIRCAYFMENWTFFLDSLDAPEPFITSTITPLDWQIPMVAAADVGAAMASELIKQTDTTEKPYVFELHGPRMYSPRDVQTCFSEVLGHEVAVRAIEKEDLHGFYSKLFPPQIVDDWVEMAVSFLPGGPIAVDKIDWDTRRIVRGETDLAVIVKQAVATRKTRERETLT